MKGILYGLATAVTYTLVTGHDDGFLVFLVVMFGVEALDGLPIRK